LPSTARIGRTARKTYPITGAIADVDAEAGLTSLGAAK
jgi:hypothetical protein